MSSFKPVVYSGDSPAWYPRRSEMMYTSPEITKFTFTAEIKGSTDSLKFQLSNPHLQDLFRWITEIKNPYLLSGWSEEYAYSLLHVLVYTELHGIMGGKRTFSSALISLLAYFFRPAKFPSLDRQAKQLIAKNCTVLYEYASKLKEAMSRAEMCLPKADRYRDRDFLEYFIRGLDSHE
ncbi:hypothetical protein ENBRE01_2187 [Enteropsectra breve]|nr:hypothetical protein ENBRE01_2187 [Enteropsectra breve]